jgi:hypothetical protein
MQDWQCAKQAQKKTKDEDEDEFQRPARAP